MNAEDFGESRDLYSLLLQCPEFVGLAPHTFVSVRITLLGDQQLKNARGIRNALLREPVFPQEVSGKRIVKDGRALTGSI
jgi:hypothetical protein